MMLPARAALFDAEAKEIGGADDRGLRRLGYEISRRGPRASMPRLADRNRSTV